jgi:Major Facilitator Superfamily
MSRIRVLLLIAAGLALADASVVTLALPPIIAELDASVEQAAAVLGVYTLVLTLALPAAAWLRPGAAVGALVFAGASLACGLAESIGALLVMRGVQAVGGAALLVGAFALLDAGKAGRRAWTATAIFGFAAGPALGGALTQALDWRAIFFVQVPLAAAAAVAAWRAAPAEASRSSRAPVSWPLGPAFALALVSAALVGVLFLLVLLLVTGWSITPLAAAVTVSVLPAAAVAAARIPGPARTRAAAGALLVAGGVLALASLPGANLWWTVPPQLMAGAGLGLALPALAGGLLPEDTPEQAAWLLSLRHAGITAALIVLAPVAAAQLDDAVAETRLEGTALVLDARLPPLEKLSLAGTLVGDIDPVDPRGELQSSLDRARAGIEDKAAFDELATRADEALVAGVQNAFAPALAICGALALIAALALLPWDRRVLAAAAAALVLAGGARLLQPRLEPEPVQIADPCRPRDLPATGGLGGALQDAALRALDRAACRFGSSREELALALVDDGARDDFEREYGVDPRSVGGLLGGVLDLVP